MSHGSQLQSDVLAELKWEPSVNAAHIGVTANAGVVSLSGHLDNYMQKQAAETVIGDHIAQRDARGISIRRQ